MTSLGALGPYYYQTKVKLLMLLKDLLKQFKMRKEQQLLVLEVIMKRNLKMRIFLATALRMELVITS